MSTRLSLSILRLSVGLLLVCQPAWCQIPAAAAMAPEQPPPEPQAEAITLPRLLSQPPVIYPEAALRHRLEGQVELELTVEVDGSVSQATVVTRAGHGFDQAAAEAARRFAFEPAQRAGVPVRSKLRFTYEFHLPPLHPRTAVPESPSAASLPAASREPVQTLVVLGNRPITAASSTSVRDRDFQLRPIGGVQDILRVTPGLVVIQHSGGGKANQYFLRGFDADHGTDVAFSLDGVPINLVSHAHGQGFSDTHFIIPEVVERVEISKGPYFVNQGNFATAGAVNLVSRSDFEHSSVGFGLSGSPGYGAPGYRGLVIASPRLESLRATFAAEVGRSNGPFQNPDKWDRYKLWNKLTLAPTASSTLSVGELSYASNWHGSGQIPARAIDQGSLSRFGSVDSAEGGSTARHQVFAHYRARPNGPSELKALAYVGTYRFNLYSNFTLFLNDPDQGDEIEQVDRRTFYGGRLSYRVLSEVRGVRFDTTIGADGRSDDIQEQLWRSADRVQLVALRNNGVHESTIGTFINEEIAPFPWLRANLGLRADLVSFAVDNQLSDPPPDAPTNGVGAAHQLSPKGSLIVTPLQRHQASVDLYVNYGHGFHSNDVRGAFTEQQITPLTRAVGREIGARARLLSRFDVALAFWQLDLDSETVWVGDEGTTEVSDATTRRGIELETRYDFTSWLAADLDLTFTRSRFRNDASGNGLPLAPKQTWSGGISARHELGPGKARAAFRFYGIGNRLASDDGEIEALGFTQFDLHAGYRHRWFDVALDVENVFNATLRAAQFATVSRLQTEPAVGEPVPAGFSCGRNARLASDPSGGAARGLFFGCEDVSYTPAYPLTVRLIVTAYLD